MQANLCQHVCEFELGQSEMQLLATALYSTCMQLVKFENKAAWFNICTHAGVFMLTFVI